MPAFMTCTIAGRWRVSLAFSKDDEVVLGGTGTRLNNIESLIEKHSPFSILLQDSHPQKQSLSEVLTSC